MAHRTYAVLAIICFAFEGSGCATEAELASREEVLMPLQTGSSIQRRVMVKKDPDQSSSVSKKKPEDSEKKKSEKKKEPESEPDEPASSPKPTATPRPPAEEKPSQPDRFR